MKKKHITFLTGKRGGYDAMFPLLSLLRDARSYDLSIIVCDQHMLNKFGATAMLINTDGFDHIYPIISRQETDTINSRVTSLSCLFYDVSIFFQENETDLLILFGDRGESLMGTIAALYHNIPIAHIQAGDRTGTLDDIQRHMISKASSLMFTSCTESTLRLIGQGEDLCRIHQVGDLHIDRVLHTPIKPVSEIPQLAGLLGLERKPIITIIMHPDTAHPGVSEILLTNALIRLTDRFTTVGIYPCSDQGYAPLIEILDRECDIVIKNMPQEDYLSLLSHSAFCLGNSSSFVIEAPYLGTSAILLGDRQTGRTAATSDIIRWNPLTDPLPPLPHHVTCNNIYGTGHATEAIMKILDELDLALLKERKTFL